MLKPRGDLDLALKSVGAHRRGQIRMKHLERYGTLVLLVANEPHGGHAAAAKHSLNE